MTIHLLRMAAGVTDMATLDQLIRQETRNVKGLGAVCAIYTRNKPKREADLLEGGSVYSIMRSMIQCRRRVLDVREAVDSQGVKYCEILLDPTLIRVIPTAQRPFQGWRYLDPVKAPADLGAFIPGDTAPPDDLAAELRASGLL